jgi:signal transduction histidine kinase
MRNLLYAGRLAFAAIEKGSVGVSGSTGATLRRCLRDLGAVVDRSMAEARMELELQKRERVRVAELIEEVGIAAAFQADARGHQFVVDPVEFGIVVDADRQILTAALGNLLQNAFKFTRPHSKVSLRTRATEDRVVIDVADECGGLVGGDGEALFRAYRAAWRRPHGTGLGLSVSRRGVEANGGQLRVRDLPGTGCVFTVDLPRLRQRQCDQCVFSDRRSARPPAPSKQLQLDRLPQRGTR